MKIKDTEFYKRKQLWYLHESKMAWIGFYKQNNKFGNYDKTIAKLIKEERELAARRFPSKVFSN